MANTWRQAQQEYYNQQRSRKSGKKWAATVLTKLIHVGRKQWLHRNDYKHKVDKADLKKFTRTLDKAIIQEYADGPTHLLPGDEGKMNINMLTLLDKPLHVKRAWWNNIHQARLRYLRVKQEQEAERLRSRENSLLVKWLKGRLPGGTSRH